MKPQVTKGLLTAITFANLCAYVFTAPTRDAHPIKSRDTDVNVSRKAAIHRIQELLNELEPDDVEGDLRTLTRGVDSPRHKVEAEEKDMRSLDPSILRGPNPPLTRRQDEKQDQHGYAIPPPPKTKPDEEDDAIKALAHALASLDQPEKDVDNIDGERMGNQYNEASSEDKSGYGKGAEQLTGDLEEAIARALARLEQEDASESEELKEKQTTADEKEYHDAAVEIVESHLMKDMDMASRLGLTVDDLITDLSQQEAREETLRKLDEALASYGFGDDQ